MSTATLEKTETRLFIFGRGVVTADKILDSVRSPKLLKFTVDHGIDSISLSIDKASEHLATGAVTFEGTVATTGERFVGFFDTSNQSGNITIWSS